MNWTGRRQAILPVVAASREPIDLQEDWTIGLDVTSVMVLSHLGLLEKAIGAFHHTKLAPETMECLFREQDEGTLPSAFSYRGIGQANERAPNSGAGFKSQSNLTRGLPTISHGRSGTRTGHTPARGKARQRQESFVFCRFSKVGSLAEQTADTRQYDDLIHSTSGPLHPASRQEAGSPRPTFIVQGPF